MKSDSGTKFTRRQALFLGWSLLASGLFVTSAFSGYSPFGDGRQERDAYSRGGGPTHK